MNLELARKIKNICYIASIVAALPAFILDGNDTIYLIVAVVIMAIGIVVSVAFYRCPSCKTPLPTNERLPDKCPHCGETLR